MITSVFVITIHLSELAFADLYFVMVDFLSTVRGDYGKGEIKKYFLSYENIKYRNTSLLCKNSTGFQLVIAENDSIKHVDESAP